MILYFNTGGLIASQTTCHKMSNFKTKIYKVQWQNHFNESNERIFWATPGLFVLFFTSFGNAFPIMVCGLVYHFLVAETTSQNPGFGWSMRRLWLYGWYTMLVYIAAIPGDGSPIIYWVKKDGHAGWTLLCLGHGILAFDNELSFYIGCAFIILGVGGLNPIFPVWWGLYPRVTKEEI